MKATGKRQGSDRERQDSDRTAPALIFHPTGNHDTGVLV